MKIELGKYYIVSSSGYKIFKVEKQIGKSDELGTRMYYGTIHATIESGSIVSRNHNFYTNWYWENQFVDISTLDDPELIYKLVNEWDINGN